MATAIRVITAVSATFGPGLTSPFLYQAGYRWEALVCLVCAAGMVRIAATIDMPA